MMACRSKDLRHRERPHAVFAQQGAWVPEVHEYKGRFYLLITLFTTRELSSG